MKSGAAAVALALNLLGGQNAAATLYTGSFMSGGVPVSTEWFRSAAATDKSPAVILLHGADGLTRADSYRLGAQALAAAGFHVILVRYLERTGDKRVNWVSLREDAPLWLETVRDAVTYAASRPEVDQERIAIVGFSLGASLALAAAGEDKRIKAVVDVFGPMPAGADKAAHTPPVLILHGARDRIVPVDNAYRLEAHLKAKGVPHEMMIYPDQGHGFFGTSQMDAGARILAFLDRHLRGGEPEAP